jgi:hypothetical protein
MRSIVLKMRFPLRVLGVKSIFWGIKAAYFHIVYSEKKVRARGYFGESGLAKVLAKST